jgi:hypothetical protein
VPTTFVGLALIVLALAPGLAFFVVRGRHRPERELTPLQELGGVILASVVCISGAIGLFAAFRSVLPGHTPDIGQLIRRPAAYWREEYAYLAIWATSLLLLSCALGGGLGALAGRSMWPFAARGPIVPSSAWFRMFHEPTDVQVYVRCWMEDGSAVSGYLGSASPQAEETQDRDLVLVGPIRSQRDRGAEPRPEPSLSAVILSAHRIAKIEVAYLDPGTAEAERAAEEVSSESVEIPGWGKESLTRKRIPSAESRTRPTGGQE